MPYKKTGDAGNGGGSAPSDMDDFIFSKWGPFATDQGFVANQAPAVGTAPEREYWTHQGTVGSPVSPFCLMRTKADQLFMFTGHTSLNAAQEIYDQPNNPCNGPSSALYPSDDTALVSNRACPVVNNSDGPWSGHHLFSNANGDYVHAVCQISARVWRHFLFGLMPTANKFGTWTGGEYMFGHAWNPAAGGISDPYDVDHGSPFGRASVNAANEPQKNGVIRCDGLVGGQEWFAHVYGTNLSITNTVNKPVGDVNDSSFPLGHCVVAGMIEGFGSLHKRLGASLIARGAALVPLTVFANFSFSGNDGYCALGEIPDVYAVNMREFTPGEQITIGSDTFVMFPVVNSDTVNTVNGDEYSGYEGLAYRIIP